jgi:hypothetical protein
VDAGSRTRCRWTAALVLAQQDVRRRDQERDEGCGYAVSHELEKRDAWSGALPHACDYYVCRGPDQGQVTSGVHAGRSDVSVTGATGRSNLPARGSSLEVFCLCCRAALVTCLSSTGRLGTSVGRALSKILGGSESGGGASDRVPFPDRPGPPRRRTARRSAPPWRSRSRCGGRCRGYSAGFGRARRGSARPPPPSRRSSWRGS